MTNTLESGSVRLLRVNDFAFDRSFENEMTKIVLFSDYIDLGTIL
jgi:hypothetical protein